LEIVSGGREGEIASAPHDDSGEEDQNEETELLEEFRACITRLFRVSNLIRQAASTDLFTKALSRNRYQFNDQFDIAHVGEKYPKLATEELAWLRKRLGRAITQRRHYLSYIQDHREKLEGILTHEETSESVAPKSKAPAKHLPAMKLLLDSSSRPSTFFTKASSLTPGHITPQMLAMEEETDSENDVRSYTTISRSIDGDLDSSTTARIPRLGGLRIGSRREVECPFCFRMKKFKNERVWRQHVLSDLRPYVCTFSDCDAPFFGDINEWFRHEMQSHRVSYACRLCQSKTFRLKERYLAHVRKQHPDILEDGEEQLVLDIARKPLDQIPARECPCCSEWVDRLKERAAVASMPSDASDHLLIVAPTVFKRHLASHLEQLALFAIPIGSAAEGDVDSNVAIEDDVGALPGGSDLSTLAFDSSRPSSPASNGRSSDDSPTTEGVVKAAAGNESEEMLKIVAASLEGQDGDVRRAAVEALEGQSSLPEEMCKQVGALEQERPQRQPENRANSERAISADDVSPISLTSLQTALPITAGGEQAVDISMESSVAPPSAIQTHPLPHTGIVPATDSINYTDPDYFKMLAQSLPGSNQTSATSPTRNIAQQVHSQFHPSYATGTPPSAPAPPTLAKDISETASAPHYFEKFFVVERELGRGGRGVVLLVKHVLDGVALGHFACKRVPIGDDHAWLERVLVEVQLLQTLSHQNLVSYRHFWLEEYQVNTFGPSIPCAFILQQYCNGGDMHSYVLGSAQGLMTNQELKERIRRRARGELELPRRPNEAKKLPSDEIYNFFRDITSGLCFLHHNNFIHRDLKPSNCLLHTVGDETRVLISDFGEVQYAYAPRKSTGATGTIAYCAPEVLRRISPGGPCYNFTSKSDIFSLGMILYFLCFSNLPYSSANVIHEEREDLDELRAEIIGWEGFDDQHKLRPDLPPALYAFLERLLSVDPDLRPSAGDVLQMVASSQTR
jgi:hypothetical protein